ncbi:hypothetical protein HG530_002641 [Fusarium avenaceum]|nr:hypothetical protein HG530_002641 [Fusarium avenaceum]
MIQNLTSLILDLDLVTDIMPLENRCLLLEHTTSPVGSASSALSSNDGTNVRHSSLRITVLLLGVGDSSRLMTTSVNEDFALGLLLRHEFGSSHPLAPSKHVSLWNDEASEDDKVKNQNGGRDKSLEETASSGGNGKGVRRLEALTLGLLGLLGSTESFGIRAVNGMSDLVFLNLNLQSLILGAVLPGSSKLVRGTRNLALETFLHDSLVRGGHRSEEIRSSLASRAFKTQVDKVLLSSIGAAKEDLSTLIDDSGLIEKVLGLEAKSFAKFDGVGRVQTSSRVIPALQRSTRQGSLGNGYTLALTTRDTSNVLVTDAGVYGVIGKVVPVQALGKLTRLSGASGESEGITNRQHGEMNIDLGGVNCFTTVVGVHLLCGHTFEVRAIINVDTVEFTSNCLESGRTTSTRRSENDKHLACVHNSVEVAQNVDALSAPACELAKDVA